MLEFSRNSFHQTMIQLDYQGVEADLFSKSCIERFDERPINSYGYLFGQVFEPSVLMEIASLECCKYEELACLRVGMNERLTQIRKDLEHCYKMSIVQVVNLAAALISISRFDLAKKALDSVNVSPCNDRDSFEIAMLEFVINNRISNRSGVQTAFQKMLRLGRTGILPAERLLDAATQAVVWHIKSNQIDRHIFESFYSIGEKLLKTEADIEAGAKSSWYRAIAMIPASQGDIKGTREFMFLANDAAEKALKARPRFYEIHFLKTYYESALKEYAYVIKDKEGALSKAESLISLDPFWSISYGEKAEVYHQFGDFEAAATYFEQAGRIGPPYLCHHFFSAAQAWEKASAPAKALKIYEKLLCIDERNPAVVVAGVRLARRLGDKSSLFELALTAINDRLNREHWEYLCDHS